MVSVPECLSESYAEARPKFCSAAAASGGEIRSWLNPSGRGPTGEALYLDVALCVICDECPVTCDGPGAGCP